MTEAHACEQLAQGLLARIGPEESDLLGREQTLYRYATQLRMERDFVNYFSDVGLRFN